MAVMDALVCSAPGELVLTRRPVPVLGEGEVLVRPRVIGVCGTDYHIFEGKHPFLKYPRVMGHELAVEVVDDPTGAYRSGDILAVNPYLSCGRCVACRRGKPNCCVRIEVLGVHRDGGMSTGLAVPARNLVRAEGLSVDACATVEFLAIGAHAVRRGVVTNADRVLVVGAGPIGLGVALFARLAGGEVTLMDIDAARVNTVMPLVGARGGIAAGPGAAEAIANATDGDGYDVVFDATGNAASIARSFDHVAHGGRYVLVSVVKGDISFVDADFHRREMTLLGSRNATSADFETVISAIQTEKVPVSKLITHRTDLAHAAKDIATWATQKAGLIKAVLEI
jgi:2-desacetyl-2-hydroxyethyl bacteriochlorophyllide A dehydrogenase